jgi:hypothetical protein
MSSQRRYTALRDGKNPGEYGVVLTIHSQAATRHGGSAEFASDNCARVTGCAGSLRANRTPPRGPGPRASSARKHHVSKTLWLENALARNPMKRPQKRKTRPGGQPDGSSYMGAGVDGRSRRIQPRWGGMTAPTSSSRGRATGRSTRRRIFLTSWQDSLAGIFGGLCSADYCAAGRLASAGTERSDANARVAGASSKPF